MKLATLRRRDATTAAVALDGVFHALPWSDVGALLAEGALDRIAPGDPIGTMDAVDYAPIVARPTKIICAGLNYRTHIQEFGLEHPKHPTLFAKFATALAGARDRLPLSSLSAALDWEAELVVVIGRRAFRAGPDAAASAIAGFCVGNDISARDLQRRTDQWLAGKTLDGSTPAGPWLVTADETGPRPDLEIECAINGETMQAGRTGDLLFDPVALVQAVSAFCTLQPGDLIFTGTPGGVGAACNPPRFLVPGDVVETTIQGLGRCSNVIA